MKEQCPYDNSRVWGMFDEHTLLNAHTGARKFLMIFNVWPAFTPPLPSHWPDCPMTGASSSEIPPGTASFRHAGDPVLV